MYSATTNPLLERGAFYGKTIRQTQAGGFNLSETRYWPGSSLPAHSHQSHYVCFVLRGSYKENYDRRVRSCRPRMIVFHPAGELHAQRFDNTAVNLFRVEVDAARNGSCAHLAIDGRDFGGGIAVGIAHKLYREFREPDEVSHLAIEGLALELMAEITRDSRRHENSFGQLPTWLTQAHELIKSRYREHLTLGRIAGAVGVHPVTLARAFRHHYDFTVVEMVRRERVNFACRKLLKREESLADIALAAGFCDQSHFAKTFKKVTGITPAQYRFHSH